MKSGPRPTFFCFAAPGNLTVERTGLGPRDLGKQIQEIANPIAKGLRLDLVEVTCHGSGPGSLVRVILDKMGGIGIIDCEQFHHSLSRALDVTDPVPHSYRLEVSSPGLDRPLKSFEDYQRSVGKLLRVKLRESVHGQGTYLGRLAEVHEHGIRLVLRKPKARDPIEVPWELIDEAKPEVEF